MPEDNIQARPSQGISPNLTNDKAPPSISRITKAADSPVGESVRPRSEISAFLGWIAGLLLVLICGWCLLGLAFYFTRDSKVDTQLGLSLAAVFSLCLFLVLEWNHWLSRLMGLRYDPLTPGWQSAILLWLLGVPGLLFRSTRAQAEEPRTATELARKSARRAETAQQTDSVREIVETVVFVVVLVLMLKSFAAEAFVIPTGSMAETLWGYQKEVTCPKCGYEFPVNTSGEVEKKPPEMVVGCVCPNCRYELKRNEMPNDSNTGDRVLVAKFLYDLFQGHPDRLDVVVFKFPKEPQKDYTPMNYIKRCIGLPGETIGIYYGKLYCLSPDQSFPYDDSKVKPEDLWKEENMRVNDPSEAVTWLKNRKNFKIIRKEPRHIDALKRIVYDNDHQASDLAHLQRWTPEKGNAAWAASAPTGFVHASSTGNQVDWLRYQHLLRGGGVQPELITDFMGYNSGVINEGMNPHRHPDANWVSDLMIDCEVTVEKPEGELVLELSKSVDRFQARFNLATGECTLIRLKDGKELDKKPTDLKKGTHHVRFANVDDRLVVWVGKSLPFGDGVAYEPASEHAPVRENDLERPASIGVQNGGVSVHKIKLWRDTYYTVKPGPADVSGVDFSDPKNWSALADLPAKTIHVHPGHYLCMGDNSPESSDSRQWGLVPQRLLLGRALLVYYPFGRAGRIE
jgi:signal peptidase I